MSVDTGRPDIHPAKTRAAWTGVRPDLLAGLNGHPPPADADWMAILKNANERLVAPALYLALAQAGALEAVPHDALVYLTVLFESNKVRNLRLKGQLAEAVTALNAVGITPMAIKGAAVLLIEDEASFGRRMMVDLDLIVPEADQDAAIGALEALGYVADRRDTGPHGLANMIRRRDGGSIDLHHRLPGPPEAFAGVAAFGPDLELQLDGGRVLVAPPTEHIAHLAIHDMLHDQRLREGSFDLRHLLDAREIIRRSPIDGPGLQAALPSGSRSVVVQLYFLSLRSLFGLPIPSGLKVGWVAEALHHRQTWKAASPGYRAFDDRIWPTAHRLWISLTRSSH